MIKRVCSFNMIQILLLQPAPVQVSYPPPLSTPHSPATHVQPPFDLPPPHSISSDHIPHVQVKQ